MSLGQWTGQIRSFSTIGLSTTSLHNKVYDFAIWKPVPKIRRLPTPRVQFKTCFSLPNRRFNSNPTAALDNLSLHELIQHSGT